MKRLLPRHARPAPVAGRAGLVVVVTACHLLCLGAVAGADLKSDVSAALRDKALTKGEAGVQIARLGADGKADVLFGHNSDIALIPASNLKLITTAAFLERFGGEFRFRTMLAIRGEDLVLIGDGDPTLGDAELLKKVGWESTTVFRNWAQLLKQRGVTRVRNVIVDDGIFDDQFVHPNWPVKQQHFRYVAGVAGVNFNANALDFYLRTTTYGSTVSYTTDPPTGYANVVNQCLTGGDSAVWLSRTPGTNNIDLKGQTNATNAQPISVTVHDPAMYAATVLAETLRGNGVRVTGEPARDRTARAALNLSPATTRPTTQPGGEPLTVIAIHETPIAAVLARANKDSMNVYAEALCKRLGAEVARESGSWANGTAAMAAFARACGSSDGEFTFDDGCGLSKRNAVSAATFVRVLAGAFAGRDREAYLASLSVAGVDGTLDNRFRDSDLRGRVFAKSGFVNGVSALSGYVRAKDGNHYAFSILMNGVSDVATCKVLQERIVKAIDAHAASASVSNAR